MRLTSFLYVDIFYILIFSIFFTFRSFFCIPPGNHLCIILSRESFSLIKKTERNGSDKREEIPRSKAKYIGRTNKRKSVGIGMLPMQAAGVGAGGDWSSFTKWISRMHKAGGKKS